MTNYSWLMGGHKITKGEDRTRISFWVQGFGNDIVIFIYNENPHIGAVAVGEYDYIQNRASTSVITRLGHKDDVIAQKTAYLISKHTKRPSCVITGIHLDYITEEEIQKFLENTDDAIKDFLKYWEQCPS